MTDATLRRLQVIGQAAHALPESVRSSASEVPWSQIIGFRNVLVHAYFSIDADIASEVIEHDLDPLATALRRITDPHDVPVTAPDPPITEPPRDEGHTGP